MHQCDVAQFAADLDVFAVAWAEHFEGGFDGLIGVGALQGNSAGPSKGLNALGGALDTFQGFGHELHVFGEMRIVFYALADVS